MFTELLSFLNAAEKSSYVGNRLKNYKVKPRSKIGSISAFSSNSIFYFPTIVSDQMQSENVAMVTKMLEINYASFVIACINMIPVHKISADDVNSITEYLNQFHQNIGINGTPGRLSKFSSGLNQHVANTGINAIGSKMLGESVEFNDEYFENVWENVHHNCEEYIKIIAETVSVNDMFNKDAIDPVTARLQKSYLASREELETWGFLGEATEDMFDSDDDFIFSDDDEDYDDDDIDEDEFDDEELDDTAEPKVTGKKDLITEGNVKSSVDQIKFSLESVSENKILSCNTLSKLSTLENKLKKLKGKYVKYLNRYKAKYQENQKTGSKSKLTIRFNNQTISNPKLFMKQYGEYIKIINKRLSLCEKRRKELAKRKGITNESADVNVITSLSELDFEVIDNCDKIITECLEAPNDKIFTIINEADDEDSEANGPILGERDHRSQDSTKMFDRQVFTDMDAKRANDATPMFTKATITFQVNDTNNVIKRDLLVGIKCYVHKAPSRELINDMYNSIINKRKFLKFVKFVTGEERSLADMLFGIKELKNEALDSKGAGQWRSAFKQRRRLSKMSIPYIMKEYIPNGSIVMTMNEANFLKDQYGIDIMRGDHVKMIMDADFLLGFVIVDESEEIVYVTYHGHGYGFQTYTFQQLMREAQVNDRLMRTLYQSFSR